MIYNFNLKIPENFIKPTNPFYGSGKHCFLFDCPEYIKKELSLEDKKIVLKVFHTDILNDRDISEIKWGDDPTGDNPRRNTMLLEATKIQNICWWYNLAPRVYAFIKVEYNGNIYPAQVTDDLRSDNVDRNKYMENKAPNTRPATRTPIANFSKNHAEAEECYAKAIKLGGEYGFEVDKKDVAMWDVIDGKLIDFQTFAFNKEYIPKLKEEFSEKTKWGKKHYHKIPELGLNGGPRTMETRIKEMKLDEIDFKGKTVLDLGCSGGLFVNYALKRGAKRAVGVDFKDDTEGARAMSNELGYYNADYIDCDLRTIDTGELRKRTGQDRFDIVLYLSMFRHVYFPSYIWEMCGETALIEWNNWKTMEEIRTIVKEKFDIIETGPTTDHGSGKEYYKCKPKE